MEFRILGPLEVSTDESPLALGGRKQRLVLAHLIVRANDVVATDVLIDEVWGEEPPDSARSTLQGYVSHLRRVLGERLEGRSNGYLLRVEDGELDAATFEALIKDAKQSLAQDPATAAVKLAEALALWRGPAFGDLADEGSLQGEVARLDELRLAATEHRMAAELAMGRHSTMVSELEALTSRYPLRERLWAHLMLALYQSGRQAEALDAYQRARGVLADELGTDPSEELQRLHRRILDQDPALRVATSPARAPEFAVATARGDLELGTEFAGYRIMAVLGRGGMSVVYLAEHLGLERKVALKVLAPQLAGDERFRERFVRESRIAAGMEHQNIVPIFEAGEAEGLLFIAMRYVPGTDLGRLIRRDGMLDPDRAGWVIRQVASALDAAHARGLVHRDVKPGNILLVEGEGSEGRDLVYLSDFGLTKRLEGGTGGGLTQTGQFVGTVDYVAPEQIEGRAVDARTDVYSLACVLYECLTGKVPFERDTQVAALYAHLGEKPTRPTASRPDLPGAVDDVIAKALAKSPAERYATCGGFSGAVREAMRPAAEASGSTPSGWRRWQAVAGAVAAALLTGVIVFSVSRGETPAAEGAAGSPTPSASPSTAPEPYFRSVERVLTEEEDRLLGYIPEDVGADCLPLDRAAPAEGEIAALVCSPPDMEVLYRLFAERTAMKAAFQINANINQAPPGECATDHLAVSTYSVGGQRAGRVLCYTAEAQPSSRRPESSHIEWTDENSAIYGHVVRSDLNDLTLYEWWLSSSGPVLAAATGGSLAKDGPTVGVSPPAEGSYLAAGPEGCGFRRTTCVMHLEGTTYDILNVGDDGPFDVGDVSLRKPASIVFTPTAGICFGDALSNRPVTYTWTGSGDRLSFERTSGGSCAGPGVIDEPWTRAPSGLLAIESGHDIGLMDTGGAFVDELTFLLETRPNTWPDWSPDGSKIVFAGAGEEGFDLYTMNADGTGVVQITDAVGDEISPAWSPDGTRIAFGFNDLGEPDHRTGIAVVDPDGSGWTELTARKNDGAFVLPAWSPDGSEIVFDIFTGAHREAYVMDADGGGPSLVRDDAVAISWTPDGGRIVLSSDGALVSVRPDGSGERVIIEDPPESGQLIADHSPDGRWFALSTPYGRPSGDSVYLMRVDGSELFEIGSGSEASWRPEIA